jgi:NitT/TauT family transport system permease protein
VSTTVVEPIPRGTLGSRVGHGLQDWIPAILVFVAGIGLWEGLVRGLDIQNFLLPPPSDIVQTLWTERDTLWGAGWFTFEEALGGWVIGCSAAVLTALVLARSRLLRTALMPYAIAANAVPIIAFAPITNNWFGTLNQLSKMVIAAVLCYFPVLVNTLRGLTSVRPQQIELMRSYAAGDVQIFRRVRIPNSLPYLFTGLKVGTVLAMIGAIVGDYFGGSQDALGIQIRRSAGVFAFTEAWAAIVVASILGIAFYGAVAAAERLTMGWHPSARGTAAD